MNIDAIALGWGAAAFLTAWAAKHFLDRMVLPRFLDWRARRSRKSALERADQLLKTFEREWREMLDVRQSVLGTEMRLYAAILMTGLLNTLVLATILPSDNTPKIFSFGLVVTAGLAVFVMLLYVLAADNRRRTEMLVNPNRYREEIIGRLRKLLAAAGLDDNAIAVWLQSVPAVPATDTH